MPVTRGKKIDYRQLLNGPKIGLLRRGRGRETWPAGKLWDVEVLDSKIVDGRRYVKLHYCHWPSKYDEWKEEMQVLIRDGNIRKCADSHFRNQLKIRIKEELHCHRKSDNKVAIRIPVQYETFDSLKQLGKLHSPSSFCVTKDNMDKFLGRGWNYRVVNKHQDFAYVMIETIRFHLLERKPLEEYDMNSGQVKLLHRGYVLIFSFLKGFGNHLSRNHLD